MLTEVGNILAMGNSLYLGDSNLVIRSSAGESGESAKKRTSKVKTPGKLKPEPSQRVVPGVEQGHDAESYWGRCLRNWNEIDARTLKEWVRRRGA